MLLGTLLLIGAIKRDKLIKLGGGERMYSMKIYREMIEKAFFSLFYTLHKKRTQKNNYKFIITKKLKKLIT